ncbi:MAG: hypothetical protein JWR10_3359 [Rubritepida sp.]|nr:hypothetical protein [Rubritepida sp.]
MLAVARVEAAQIRRRLRLLRLRLKRGQQQASQQEAPQSIHASAVAQQGALG